MKSTMKAFLAIALAVFMTLGSLPVNTVFAEEPVTEVTEEPTQDENMTEEGTLEVTDEVTEVNVDEVPAVEEEEEQGETPAPETDEDPVKEEAPEVPAAEEPTVPEEAEAPEEETPAAEGSEETVIPEETEVSEETEVPTEESVEEVPEEVTVVEQTGAYNGVNVKATYNSDTFGSEVTLVVSEAGETETAALEEAFGSNYKAVDISFVNEAGEKVQPLEGKSVDVELKAEGMAVGEDYKALHVDAEGKFEVYDTAAETEETTVTRTLTRDITEEVPVYMDKEEKVFHPAETELQKVEKTREVEVPAVTTTHYERKTRVVEKTRTVVVPSVFSWLFGRKTKTETYYVTEVYYEPKTVVVKPATTKTETYYAEEEVVVKEAYTETVVTQVPNGTRLDVVGTEEYEAEVPARNVTTKISADSFSVYAIIVVDPDGGIDFDETFGNDHITVKAPAGAFEQGTEMKIESIDDPTDLLKAAAVLGNDQVYHLYGLDISFWKDGKEVQPVLPVEVNWETVELEDIENKVVHVGDDGKASVRRAAVNNNQVVFTANEFSEWILAGTEKQTAIPKDKFTMNPSSLTLENDITCGVPEDVVPEFEEYSFVNAKVGDAVATYIGYLLATYNEVDDEGTVTGNMKTEQVLYYRTAESEASSDIIALKANETITLNYDRTPYAVAYNIVYDGTTYTVVDGVIPDALKTKLGSDADALSLVGPEVVAEDTAYEQAVALSLPRGYSATVRMSNESAVQEPRLGAGSEPSYTTTDGWTVTPDDYPFTIEGKYTISNVTNDLTVTVNLSKRTSYTFTAVPAFSTAYFGGRNGDTKRYTTRDALTSTFTGSTKTFTFTTAAVQGQNYNNYPYEWIMDSFNINKQPISVPYVNANNRTATAETVLQSGTKITLTATFNPSNSNRVSPTRTYTVSISNCYENITVTGGNLHGSGDHEEWVVQETTNLEEFDYLGSEWFHLEPGEPMTFTLYVQGNYYKVGTGPNPSAVASYYYWEGYYFRVGHGPDRYAAGTHYYYNGSTRYADRVIRFKVKDGYVNPQIKYITQEGTDQYTRVGDVTLASTATDKYHLVTSEPDADGYYYFHLKGTQTDPGLLSVKAELARYGVTYQPGDVTNAEVPPFDEGGYYGDESLQGYNAADNAIIPLAKAIPTDPSGHYVFLNYTIDGDDSGDTYAPSQKVDLDKVAKFGVYDEEKGEYVIPLTAHWVKKEQAETVTITVKFVVDGDKENCYTAETQVIKGSTVYVDIDSEEMTHFMEEYNWQLFYDELDSDSYLENADKDTTLELRLYSKFYVYHSATGELQLHTTKEYLKDGKTTYDLAGTVTDGYLYGGYYKNYGGAYATDGTTNLVQKAADYDNDHGTLTPEDVVALRKGEYKVLTQVSESETLSTTTYDGKALKDSTNSKRFWTKSDAYTDATVDGKKIQPTKDEHGNYVFNEVTFQVGGKGTEMIVEPAAVYYLKEVPSCYLGTSARWVYDEGNNNKIEMLYLLTPVDDTAYKTIGYDVITTEEGSKPLTSKFTYAHKNSDEIVTVRPQDLTGDRRGYIAVVDASNYIGNVQSATSSSAVTIKPFWYTLDNVKINTSGYDLYNNGSGTLTDDNIGHSAK